ncbi:hypothetical protein [Salidesulfovibrio onnuriiensis]|uniref:hypothetical protein n=1 Tax=Salidesulfovibrio onnuriiensis TaxID=2583823 RepID=UPI0011C88006|nr:hypothetical protein [Salidesulfovibrio onnuriiensis]
MATLNVHCPYCSHKQPVEHADDYSPAYAVCKSCNRRFIVEPVATGVMVYRDGEAPCCSDPECRENELAASGQD